MLHEGFDLGISHLQINTRFVYTDQSSPPCIIKPKVKLNNFQYKEANFKIGLKFGVGREKLCDFLEENKQVLFSTLNLRYKFQTQKKEMLQYIYAGGSGCMKWH